MRQFGMTTYYGFRCRSLNACEFFATRAVLS
jgi:hypothetical protein